MDIGIIAFGDNGNALLQKVTAKFDETFFIFDKTKQHAKDWLYDKFYNCHAIVFIGALGIAVRLIANLIDSKDKDPAVIVIDEKGKFVISVLSGHIGGANALSQRLADTIGAIPVITTATDLYGKFAVDVWSSTHGCFIDDITKIKAVSGAILKEEEVGFYSDFPVLNELPKEIKLLDKGKIGICLSLDPNKKPFDTTLNIIPQIITLGIGCKKNTSFEDLDDFILKTLEEYRISFKAIKNMASIDLKKEEECLLQFAKKYRIEFAVFSKEQLKEVQGTFASSEFVRLTAGVDNVCERSAVLQSGGKLILKKITKNGMAIAAAIPDWGCTF